MTSVAPQEAVGNYEMQELDTEESDQETPAKNRRLGTARGETLHHGFLPL